MIFFTNYYSKYASKKRSKNEIISMKFALNPGQNAINYLNPSTEELKTLRELKKGTYANLYQGKNRKIVDEYYKAQRSFDTWMLNLGKQTRKEAKDELLNKLYGSIAIIGFILLLIYFHFYDTSNPNL